MVISVTPFGNEIASWRLTWKRWIVEEEKSRHCSSGSMGRSGFAEPRGGSTPRGIQVEATAPGIMKTFWNNKLFLKDNDALVIHTSWVVTCTCTPTPVHPRLPTHTHSQTHSGVHSVTENTCECVHLKMCYGEGQMGTIAPQILPLLPHIYPVTPDTFWSFVCVLHCPGYLHVLNWSKTSTFHGHFDLWEKPASHGVRCSVERGWGSTMLLPGACWMAGGHWAAAFPKSHSHLLKELTEAGLQNGFTKWQEQPPKSVWSEWEYFEGE